MQVEQEVKNPLLLSGHPSAKDTYQALEGVLQDQVVRSACVNEARGILKAMMAHRKRLGELEQQYGRIVPEAEAGGVPLVAEASHAQSATTLEDLPVDVVCELMKREFDLGRATVHVYEGAIRQARMDICGLRRPIPWVSLDWHTGKARFKEHGAAGRRVDVLSAVTGQRKQVHSPNSE